MALNKLSLFRPSVGYFTNLPISVSFTLSSKTSLGGYTGEIGLVRLAVFNGIIVSSVISSPVPVASSLHDGQTGVIYSTTIGVQGGTGPFVFTIAAGTLPAGLSLNASTGVISGTPTTVGTSTFTVSVTDTNSSSGSQSFSIAISAPSGSGGGGSYTFIG